MEWVIGQRYYMGVERTGILKGKLTKSEKKTFEKTYNRKLFDREVFVFEWENTHPGDIPHVRDGFFIISEYTTGTLLVPKGLEAVLAC